MKDASQDDPSADDIYRMGTVSTVLQLLKLPDGTVKVLVEGVHRAEIQAFIENPEFFQADTQLVSEENADSPDSPALVRTVVSQFEQYVKLNKKVPPEVMVSLNQIEDPSKLTDTVASHLVLNVSEKQELLEIVGVVERLEKVYALMTKKRV